MAIAAGGAVGALARFGVSNLVHQLVGRGFPWGTLLVNVVGSLAMGLLYVLFLDRITSVEWRAAILVGFLGAFTTFSTFSIETFNLMESGEYLRAGANALLSVTLCLAAAWLGVLWGRNW